MKLNIVILMLAVHAMHSFETKIEDFGMVSDPEDECNKDLMQLIDILKQIKKAGGDIQKILMLIMEAIPYAQGAYENCSQLDPKQVMEMLMKHLNDDGKACVQDIMNDSQKVAELIQEYQDGKITLQELFSKVMKMAEDAPKIVNECKNARFKL